MSELLYQEIAPSPGPTTGRLRRQYAALNAASSLLQRIAEWIARQRQRRALAELDAHLLDDIGVSQEAARREAAKRFWL